MQQDFSLKAYDYLLPQENIAQHPADAREDSRLMILHRCTSQHEHGRFHQIIDLLGPKDLLVVNDTKVFPARLPGRKESGGKVEVFLLSYPTAEKGKEGRVRAEVTALVKSSKRPKPGSLLLLGSDLEGRVLELLDGGKVKIELSYPAARDLSDILEECGQVPLPPYISRKEGSTDQDRQRYQTVYARESGAVAAPTAGLHFSEELLRAIREKGVETARITLHVGHGTFAPVRCDDIREHQIHGEAVTISAASAERINKVRKEGGKVWAVGTTSVRTLEFMADKDGLIQPGSRWCDLYILPGYEFRVVDGLITNFHLPQSSLLFLVSAFYGREPLMKVYQEAITMGYRFYSYGDAMVICP